MSETSSVNKALIPNAPPEFFEENITQTKIIHQEKNPLFLIEFIEVGDKGIEVHYQEAPFPRKGFPTPQAITAINVAKRALRQFLPLHPVNILFPKRLRRMLDEYIRTCNWLMRPNYMKYICLAPASKEVLNILTDVCVRLNLDKELAKILAHIIQYDDAYRYRLEDICSETSVEQLVKNPSKEILRLGHIMARRELVPGLNERELKLFKLFSFLLKLPPVKKLFRSVISLSDFSKLQYDDADMYWTTHPWDYNFRDISKEERLKTKLPPHVFID